MSRKERWPFAASAEGLMTQIGLLRSESGFGYIWLREYRFHLTRKWRFDAAFPGLKIGVEYHGGLFMGRKGGHQTARGARNDWEKLNEAQILGWTVLQFGPDETRSGEAMYVIERAIKARLSPEMARPGAGVPAGEFKAKSGSQGLGTSGGG